MEAACFLLKFYTLVLVLGELQVITLANFEHVYLRRKKADNSSSSTGSFWAQQAHFDLLTKIPSLSQTTSYLPSKKKTIIPSENSQFFLKPLVPTAQLIPATNFSHTHTHNTNMATSPRGVSFGPLNLVAPFHPLPQGTRKNFPKFYED